MENNIVTTAPEQEDEIDYRILLDLLSTLEQANMLQLIVYISMQPRFMMEILKGGDFYNSGAISDKVLGLADDGMATVTKIGDQRQITLTEGGYLIAELLVAVAMILYRMKKK